MSITLDTIIYYILTGPFVMHLSHCANDNALIKCFECLTVARSFDMKCTCF